MPHGARRQSESGYYHVVPKGIADQIIFEDDGDRRRYIDLLGQARDAGKVLVHAYCLMSNHVHLILEDPKGDGLAAAMKFLHERYAMYLAGKIGRTGGIFRKPYWSEPIGTDGHLLCAVRYVHANPAAAGICPASTYEWSSARDYLGREGITHTETVLDMVDGREGFIEWSRAANYTANPFPGSKLSGHLTDDEAITIARAVLERNDLNLASVPKERREGDVNLLSDRGFTIAQIARITGLGRRSIEVALGRR